MKMQTLTVNGQTYTVEDPNALRKVSDCALDMRENAIENVEALYLVHGENSEVAVYAWDSILAENGYTIAGILEYSEVAHDSPVILRHLADGIRVDDAATVGQVDACEKTENKVTAIDETATDDQYPSALAVQSALSSLTTGLTMDILYSGSGLTGNTTKLPMGYKAYLFVGTRTDTAVLSSTQQSLCQTVLVPAETIMQTKFCFYGGSNDVDVRVAVKSDGKNILAGRHNGTISIVYGIK